MNKYLLDLTERVALTFAFAFLSVFTVGDLSTAKSALVAGAAAALSLIKGVVAAHVGNPESASLSPKV